MPRLVRRFEPRCGVTRPMIEAEAKYVGREMESYLRLSTSDLRQKLLERGEAWHHADEALHASVLGLAEHERLALQCLLVRDLHFILELYLEHLRTCQPEAPPPMKPQEIGVPRQPFGEWLFGS